MSALTCKIELFGSLRVVSGENTVTRFRTHKTGLLLAYLACFPQRPQRREELIYLLWPEYELDSGRNCLRIALNALRQQLDLGTEFGPAAILADRQHVQLNPQAIRIDKSEFEACLASAQRAASDEERVTFLKQAIALYQGDLLLDYDPICFESERKRLSEAHLLALRRLIRLLVKSRALEESLHYAQSAVAADPLREESHRVLMQLHGALGNPGAALRQYQELARVLGEELDATPSAAAQALLTQITKAQPGQIASTSPISTLVASASTPPPPPPATSPFVPGVLPIPRTRFFGREDSLAQVLEMFDTPETRLVTLTGLGGSGKTRLALAVAERLHADFHGAVWFVPLAALTSAERIPEALLQALSLRSDGTLSAFDQVIHTLSGRSCLLVLDNFEHLTEKGALVVQKLLDHVPTLNCLITSRQRLNIAGEYEYAVLPLATPQSPGTPERLQEFASVQLFVDRARAARLDFQLTAANAGAVAALCHHLEGVPLSIELAAAYVQALTPAQIRARLTPRLPLLVNRQRDAVPRHASLRATLDWSFQLLPDTIQRFLARLSVFRGGWSLEGAEAVCAEPEALEYLLQLRERSLVTVEEIDDAMRYRLLETVREYAAEQLTSEESLATSRRHAVYFLAEAEMSEAELAGPAAPVWLKTLELEHPNFRSALSFTLEEEARIHGQGSNAPMGVSASQELPAHAALRLAGSLSRFWYMRGHYDEGSDWLGKALAISEYAALPRMKALRGLGNLAYDQGQFERAHTSFTQLLSLARQEGRLQDEAAALGSLGNVALARGDLDQAGSLLQESLALFRQSDDLRGTALVLANFALVTLDRGNPVDACTLYRESLALFERNHDTQNIALAHNNLGHAALQAGDYVSARHHLLSSLALARELGSPFLELYVIGNLTCLLAQQQRWRQAALLCGVTDRKLQEQHAGLLPRAAACYHKERETIESALGHDHFLQAWEYGQNMRIDQVEALVNDVYTDALALNL